ncbi:AI-2E family transporter [Saxibacter everestensis]|uniref:AI-2E family transporter n=1 Tax=Saxibacter everestensis TaxID=2909229 RepID=A0ABY8QQN3_9MICO|nr:AI-2E family transporter [Brevibacteriaceae bacterium ZFBP1038]
MTLGQYTERAAHGLKLVGQGMKAIFLPRPDYRPPQEPEDDVVQLDEAAFEQEQFAVPDAAPQPVHRPRRFGAPGPPFNVGNPLYFGFVGAVGVLLAIMLWQLVGRLSDVLSLIVCALFIALGLEPVVAWLVKKKLPRPVAILAVFGVLIAAIAGFISSIVPTISSQTSDLLAAAPQYVNDVMNSRWFIDLNEQFGLINGATEELERRLSDSETITALLGGVVGAGRAVFSGAFGIFTVLVLTLYFLASLPLTKEWLYRLAPRSRRERTRLLGDEIMNNIGRYVSGQVLIASLNGVCTYIMLSIVGIPYATILAVVAALFGLIPLVGATIGAVIIVIISLFQSWQSALVVLIYYVAYQQLENYVIQPRVMSRAVSVPGAVAVIAALCGGALAGVLGAITAIPVAAAVMLLIREVLIPRQDQL